jgi:hypothetical protein
VIVVIQSDPNRQPQAGRINARNGQPVLFVADPTRAPDDAGVHHARPDAPSNFCISWRKLVASYNSNPRDNPLGLLPAYKLYQDEIFAQAVEQLGKEQVFILSPGWGLIPSSFLTPDYDITFDSKAEPYRRRKPADNFDDFCMLPMHCDEDLYFFGDADCLSLFCKLTEAYGGKRFVFHPKAGLPEAPGCEIRSFDADERAGWHRNCARAFLSTASGTRTEEARQSAPRVHKVEARLRALRSLPGAVPLRHGGGREPSLAAIRKAIRGAKSYLAAYRWLMQSLPDVDVSNDKEFQQRFSAFHRISHRSPAWQATYFQRLEVAKVIGAEFADVLEELWEETGRYEPAYASRLVATVDPGQPVWDQHTLTRTGLRAPGYLDPDKLRHAGGVYYEIRKWYAAYLESPGGQRLVACFDEEAPELRDINALKKVEFALMPVSRSLGILETAGTSVA